MSESQMNSTWRHDDLQHDLAEHLRGNGRVVWTDMQLGPSGSMRPDCFSIEKSFTKFRPIVHEIKISRADFRSDTTSGKWQKYLAVASGVYFAVPSGLVTKSEIPEGCGLVIRNENGWKSIKAPTLKSIDTLPRNVWLKLVIDGIDRQRAQVKKDWNQWAVNKKIAAKYGQDLARALSNRDSAQARLEEATRVLNEAVEDAQGKRKALLERDLLRIKESREGFQQEIDRVAQALGLSAGSNPHSIGHALRSALQRLREDSEVRRLRRSLERVKSEIDTALVN